MSLTNGPVLMHLFLGSKYLINGSFAYLGHKKRCMSTPSSASITCHASVKRDSAQRLGKIVLAL
jgi:hypothetical protein